MYLRGNMKHLITSLKYTITATAALLLCGCIKRSSIEFTGNTPGIKSGVFIVKTMSDSTLYGENIKDGKFAIAKKSLKEPGYYMMNVTDDANNDNHDPFEIYLESGSYTIETTPGKLFEYPKITSSSKIQEQLSAFYVLSDKLSNNTQREVKALNQEIKLKGNSLSQMAYTQLLNKLSAAEASMTNNNVEAFKEFIKQYPNSEISTHLMTKLNYEDDPVSFYALYKTLSPAAKNTDEGKDIGDKLSHLIKLVPGVKAPAIVGNMPDGKPFDPKSINKKVILIDFWRASNDISRRNHQQLLNLLADKKDGENLAIVSVSLDSKKDWWTGAIKEDAMNWAQVSDLKGDDSANAANWSITTIPTYYLLDGNWNIIERNIDIGRLDFEVNDYIQRH